jgi:biopolymer transport protein ExbD
VKIEVGKGRRFVTFISMSDISFLLLIFEILFLSVIEKEKVDLPRFEFSQKTSFGSTMTLIVLGADAYLADDGEVDLAGLRGVLRARSADPALVVDVFADRSLDYALVDRILSLCQEEGVTHVLLEAVKKDE